VASGAVGLLASGSSFPMHPSRLTAVGVYATSIESSPVTVAGAAPAFNRLPSSNATRRCCTASDGVVKELRGIVQEG
jgi:hypothetical protein